jgi:glycosyltransferase involved in cell wall biosynthesis
VAVIAIVTSAPPLTPGGHLVIARALEHALREAGHEAGIVTTPSNRFGRQATAYLANRFTDVGVTGSGRRIDQVISLRFPSYAVRHPRHVCWLNHTMREYYDQWDALAGGLSARGRMKESVRRAIIRRADTYCFGRVTRLFAQSRTVQARLRRWNGVDAEVLYPPPPPRPYRCDEYGDTLFFTSRLSALKRADLLLRALAEPLARTVRCVIGGDGEERERLVALAAELGLGDRVTFAGHLDEDALVTQLARCRAVVFVPKAEDYGFVTAEAFASAKAVVTCSDSGGPAELVRDGENGLVAAPEPAALAAALARLHDDAALAERLGRRARQDVAALSWPAVVERLVLPPIGPEPPR